MKERKIGARSAQEKGQVLILFVLALAVLMGFTAMAIDVGLFLHERRNAQNAADAAALAGAQELDGKPDAVSRAEARAQDWAANNGFAKGMTATTPYGGHANEIEVKITKDVPALFAKVLGKDSFGASARAVAAATKGGGIDAAFLILSPHDCKAFEKSGSGNLIINGPGGIMVDSDSPCALYHAGGGKVSAATIDEKGGYQENGQPGLVICTEEPTTPCPKQGLDPIVDPLKDLAPPALTCTSPNSGGTSANPKLQKLTSGNYSLKPGVYWGGLDIESSANVTFQPGGPCALPIYIMAGGGFKIGGNGTVTGNGVLLYNTCVRDNSNKCVNNGPGACQSIDIGGGGTISISGIPYGPGYPPAEPPIVDKLVFWQDKACPNPEPDLKLVGNGNTAVDGAVYAPEAHLQLSGTGSLGSIQVVVNTATVSGTGNLTIDFTKHVSIPLKVIVKLVE